ncbi:MAG: ABC transporter permease [Nitratireductor sp.]|nr:ABC transporter permease [Nitratireductor sp.]
MTQRRFKTAYFVIPAVVFMIAVYALPLAGVALQSVTDADGGSWSLAGYRDIFSSTLFYKVAWSTFTISLLSTTVSLSLAFPLAYFLSKQRPKVRAVLMIFVLVPFWTSVLVKAFAFTILLGQSGIINDALAFFGLGPLPLLFNKAGVIVGMSHFLIPFMVFPILTSLMAQPPELRRAASIMGAGRLRIFFRITLPLCLPGIMTGTLLVLILSLGFFVVPALLGGRQDMMLSNLVDFYTRETLNWQAASTLAVILFSFAMIVAYTLARVPGGSSLLGGQDR